MKNVKKKLKSGGFFLKGNKKAVLEAAFLLPESRFNKDEIHGSDIPLFL